jgi:hypothetical protein
MARGFDIAGENLVYTFTDESPSKSKVLGNVLPHQFLETRVNVGLIVHG